MRSSTWRRYSGLEAIRLLEDGAAGQPFDVVVVDVDMPGVDGFETMSRVRQQSSKSVPVILMASTIRCNQLPLDGPIADALLSKPVTGSNLLDTVNGLLFSADGPSQSDRKQEAVAGLESLLGMQILVVEDNELNQIVAKGLLSRAGAVVTIASNGSLAVDTLRARPNDFDIVLMDVQMPVMDGFEASRIIRDELGVVTPIVAMTAGVMADERQRCTAAGMIDFIGKPLEVERMLATIVSRARKQLPPKIQLDAGAEVYQGQFEISALLRMSESDSAQRKVLVHLIAGIVERSSGDLERAQSVWQNGEVDQAARLLHGLRGSIGSLGAKRFTAATLALEGAIRTGGGDSDLWAKAKNELEGTLVMAREWLQTNS